jgi:arsenite transporter
MVGPAATTTVVIVFQSLVELFGMVAYLWLLPRIIAPPQPEAAR